MTDETTPVAPVIAELSQDTFDVGDWLTGTLYPSADIEIFNDGPKLRELADLTSVLTEFEEDQRDRKQRILAPKSITEDAEVDMTIVAARAQVAAIREELVGTGAIFHIEGMVPEERDLMNKKIAKELKPSKAKFEEIEGEQVEVEPAKEGGANHPSYNRLVENAILAKSIKHVTRGGKKSKANPFTPDDIQTMRGRLPGVEFMRLANKTFECNYLNYNIDQLITTDFS